MDYVQLGNTGLRVSRLCLGCMSYGSPQWRDWVLDENAALPFFEHALKGGINFFDTADVYSQGKSEEILGRTLNKLGVERERVVIATKVCMPMGTGPNQKGLSKKHIRHAIDASLKRLDVDYVDLYQIHRFDPDCPIEETLEALTGVVTSGKVLHIGASSMYAWQFAKYLHVADRDGYSRFVSMQNHYNLIYREEEREMIPLCRSEGVGVVPWSPLARGFLAGDRTPDRSGATTRAKSDQQAHRMYYRDSDFAVVERLKDVAAQRGLSNAQVALAWILHQPGITSPIVGATKLDHLDEALQAQQLELDHQELAALAEAYRPHPVLGHAYQDPASSSTVQSSKA